MNSVLSTDQCKLVQATFAEVDMHLDGVAALFYRRLFELDPSLQPLFRTDMALQAEQFMEKLAIAVKGLEDLDSIAPFIRVLGRRHASYGVNVRDYDTVGEALAWALEEQLGSSFGGDVRAAWLAAYAAVSHLMIEGARA